MHVLQLRDAEATRELLREAQQRTAQLQADLMQTRQDAREASMAYQQERVGPAEPRVICPAISCCLYASGTLSGTMSYAWGVLRNHLSSLMTAQACR